MNKVVGSVVVVLLVGGVWYWYTATNANTGDTAIPESADSAVEARWVLENAGENEELFAPQTAVSLEVSSDGSVKKYAIGEYIGSCSEIGDSNWTLLENELTGVICWWAGGGNEIGIFKENGELVVKEGELDEGNAEIEGFRGNFKTLFAI